MKTNIYRWIVVLLIIGAGYGIFGSGTGYAAPDGGGFEVPKVQDDFEQFDPAPQPEKEPVITSNVQTEESGTWGGITQPFKNAWKWVKETTSAAWNGIVQIISNIADVIVDAGTATWNWILEYKGMVVAILSMLGVIVAVIGLVFEVPIVAVIGTGILIGELFSGLFSWISGNGLFSDGMLLDMLIGGIAGGISSLFGWAAGIGAAGSNIVRWLGTRIPWLGRAFPGIFGGGVTAGADQSLWELLKEGKVNWRNSLIAAGLGFALIFGGEYAGVKFFKNCVAYEQPSNSYLAVMLPKLNCFYSPDRGGGSGSGNNVANQVKYVALSKSDIKHFSKHIVSNFSKQAPYLSDDVLKAKLDKNSFFNPNWSTEKIITEVEKGYNEALQKGITENYIYTTGGEQITIFIHPDGKFATAYGSHKLDMSYFGR